MTAGIYLLKFSTTDTYIGKSVNVEKRWEQHLDSFINGTAASKLQEAYRRYGEPLGEVLFTCHSDHLDILESLFIRAYKPNLNTNVPYDLPEYRELSLKDIEKYMHVSTIQHIDTIKELTGHIEYLCNANKALDLKIKTLSKKRTKEELEAEAQYKTAELKRELFLLKKEIKESEIPWYKRWFQDKISITNLYK